MQFNQLLQQAFYGEISQQDQRARNAHRATDYDLLLGDIACTREVLVEVGQWLKRNEVLRFRLWQFTSDNLVFAFSTGRIEVSYDRSGQAYLRYFGYDKAHREDVRTRRCGIRTPDAANYLMCISTDRLGLGIVGLAKELDLQLPDIDVEFPDPEAKKPTSRRRKPSR